MKYGVLHDVCGVSYIVRCDGAGVPEMIAPAPDAGQAERTVKQLNAGEIQEIDAIYRETGKEDSAWCIVWCAIMAGGALALIGLWQIARWIF